MKKLIFATFVFASMLTLAAAAKGATGWLWGGGVESDGVSPWNGRNTNVGWISMNNTNPEIIPQGSRSYSVTIPTTDGPVTGYAWSENLGYIDFAPHSGCPSSPKYPGACDAYPGSPSSNVARNGNNLVGWARIVDISIAKAAGNSGGWSGWIKMNPNVGGGVTIDPLTGEISGMASAGADELGWIAFNTFNGVGHADTDPTCAKMPCIHIDTNNCSDPSNCEKDNILTQTAVCTDSCGNTQPLSFCDSCADIYDHCDNPCTIGAGQWREVQP
jgi:hypothetical protein